MKWSPGTPCRRALKKESAGKNGNALSSFVLAQKKKNNQGTESPCSCPRALFRLLGNAVKRKRWYLREGKHRGCWIRAPATERSLVCASSTLPPNGLGSFMENRMLVLISVHQTSSKLARSYQITNVFHTALGRISKKNIFNLASSGSLYYRNTHKKITPEKLMLIGGGDWNSTSNNAVMCYLFCIGTRFF